MNEKKTQSQRFNFVESEQEVLSYWDEQLIFEKTVQRPQKKGTFIFYEGPPTANGKPGIHHILARSFKDIICRYKTMQGFRVPRKAGWDTHGLPVELEVEKRLGISGKQEIEEYGIKEFNKLCKESVWEFKEEWEKVTKRIGFWLDLKNPYITYENEYIESLWWVFKQAFDKGLVYKGHKVVPQCPRCVTALSSHEVAQGYKEVTEISVYVKFPLKHQEHTYVLSWTTTPWTLPGNVALAVGEDIDYVKVKQGNEYYIIARNLVGKLEGEYEIVQNMKGSELIGMEYEPIFDSLKHVVDQKAFYMTAADFVTVQDGTGVVHTAVMYGDDDYQLGQTLNLPKVHTVNEDGTFNALVKTFEGVFVKDAQPELIEDLQKRNLLYKQEAYTHDYPFCWRCKAPLIYYAKDSWYIAMSQLQDELTSGNEKINWIPAYIKDGRFGEWLSNVKDWAISRERYWGTPLPIWECESCHTYKCIGSLQELPNPDMKDVHRPYIDEITFHCECGGTMYRDKAVMDCWFDSGAMPFAQFHYPFKHQDLIDSADFFPADYISEAIDQTRGWFYTLLAVSTFLGKGIPYKNVISLGHILDGQGRKMSKSLGNIVDPWEVINKYGTDALRLHLFTVSKPGDAKRFDVQEVAKVFRNTIMTVYNLVSFYRLYKDEQIELSDESDHVLDRWVVSYTYHTIKEITNKLEKYHVVSAARLLVQFTQEISTWYLRRSRERFKSHDRKEREKAIATYGWVLEQLLKMLAPFAPFLPERLYLDHFKKEESIHLTHWPHVVFEKINQELLEEMDEVRKIVEIIHSLRAEEKIKVRQPLSQIAVIGKKLHQDVQDILLSEVNAKRIVFSEGEKTDAWKEKNYGDITVYIDTHMSDDLKKEGFVREIIRHTNAVRKSMKLSINDIIPALRISQSIDLLVMQAIKEGKEEIAQSTLSSSIEIVHSLEDFDKEIALDGAHVRIKLMQ